MTETLLGIVGGLGPLASAAFVRTIYEHAQPRLALWSDPNILDQTASLSSGLDDAAGDQLAVAVDKLLEAGATHIVLCCIVAHALTGALSERGRDRLVSLISVIDRELAAAGEPHLMVGTSSARAAGVFSGCRTDLLVYPGEADQAAIHDLIYRLKEGGTPAGAAESLAGLRRRYGVAGLIFGCTELHLLTRQLGGGGLRGVAPPDRHSAVHPDAGNIIDPLLSIARRMA